MKRLIALLMLFAAGIAPSLADVRVPRRPAPLVDMQIIDRTAGKTLETWKYRGKTYVVGTPGNRYAVRLKNNTGKRVLVVLSVDGVNALTGDTASTSQRGYVLSPWQSAEIAGWRKSQQEVAAFYFTRLADSYAGRTDRPENVGVIGIAVFREYEPPSIQVEGDTPDMTAARSPRVKKAARAAGAPAPAAAERIGTGHGERIESHTTTVQFERASKTPAQVTSLYYDTRANLIAQGVIPAPRPPKPSSPQAFPEGGYVPDPPR